MSALKRGYISTDAVERALGGETYKAYQEALDKENSADKDDIRFTKDDLKSLLSEEVYFKVKDEKSGWLAESYRDKARVEQALEIDEAKYRDLKNQEAVNKTIENARKAGLNNTNRTRDLFDLAVKVSADKGLVFGFADNDTLKSAVEKQMNDRIEQLANIPIHQRTEAQSQELKNLSENLTKVQSGKITVDGNITNNGITLNLNSERPLNTILGHEVTHNLEGTEHYKKLQDAIFEYAKAKKEYQKRFNALKERYKGIETTDEAILKELASDLVGDYLFNDYNFVLNLATNHRNVFQKIFDEIKYLCKIATAGSKEARALEKVKHNFENAYRETSDVTEARKNAFSIDEKGEKWYNETNTNTTKKGVNNGREETNGNKNLYSGGSDKEALLGNDNRWRSISFSDVHGRTRRISEVLTKQKDKEKINSLAEDIYQRPRTETQDILVWHAKKEDINLFFLKMRCDEANEFVVDDNNLFIPENTTEASFIDILDTIKPIERNVDENKVAHISEERRDKFLSLFPDAYITRIPIQQFLDMTTESNVDQRQIYSASSKISQTVPVENIKNTSGEYMYLKVDVKNGEVISHEGRHRMTALLNAGNAYADIFVISDNARNESYKNLVVKGQFNEKKHTISLIKAKSERFATAIDNMFWRDDGNISYALSNSVIDNTDDKGYTYTKEKYEQFGWAREVEALSKNELDDLYSKIKERSTLRTFKRSSKGEAIIEVNDKPHTTLGVNNVFVFVKGTKNNFTISRVVRFDAQTEVEMEIYKEVLYEGRTCSSAHLAFLVEKKFARQYTRESAKSFDEYKGFRDGREESRGADQDNRRSEQHGSGYSQTLGENGETNVRYALSDEDGKERYIYTKEKYEQFGWAREVEALSKNELDDLYSKIKERSTLRTFKRSSKGEAIIEVNDKPHTTLGVNNVFVFVKGTKNNFTISRVVRFDAQTEVEMEIYKEVLYEGRTCSDTYLAFLEEQEVTREYRVENYKSFAKYKRSLKDRETSRGAYQDNRGPEEHGSGHSQALGENGETNVRYALSDEDGKERYIYTKEKYEQFGWARENDILNEGQNRDYRSKFSKAVNGDKTFRKTNNGEYMIPVSDIYDYNAEGINNTIVYAKGTIDNPIITRILKIDLYNETELSDKRSELYALERKGIRVETGELFRFYTRANVKNYVEYQRSRAQDVRHNDQFGTYRGRNSEATSKVDDGTRSPYLKVVQTFKDISGKTKSIIKIGSEYYIKDNHKAQPAKSIEQAIENENKRVIIRYAKKYDVTAGMARRRLEENSNFLIEERKKGARFAISETDTDTVDTSDSVGKKRQQYNASIKERIFTAADSIYIDTVDEMYGAKKYLSKVGKIKNADDIIQAVRASMSASQTMLGDVQYDIFSDDGKKVGEGLSKIMKPITLKGDTVKINFNEYLMHWRNVDSMTLEERTEGKIPNKSIFGENENRSEAVTAEQSRKRIDELIKQQGSSGK